MSSIESLTTSASSIDMDYMERKNLKAEIRYKVLKTIKRQHACEQLLTAEVVKELTRRVERKVQERRRRRANSNVKQEVDYNKKQLVLMQENFDLFQQRLQRVENSFNEMIQRLDAISLKKADLERVAPKEIPAEIITLEELTSTF